MRDNKKGFIIAFVGQDGAGKTTISNIMIERLKKNNDVKSMYLGSGENYSSLIKTFYKSMEKRHNHSFIKEISGMLFYLQVAKRCATKANKSKKMVQNGTIIFWDRCPQIQFVGINDGPKIESKFGKSKNFLTRLIYPYFQKKEMYHLKNAVKVQPDIVVKLHLSVEESMRRKPDNDINKMKKKHTIVETLKFPNSEVIDIDANQPIEQEISQIYTYIEEYSSRNSPIIKDKKQEFLKQIQQINSVETRLMQEDKNNMMERDNIR